MKINGVYGEPLHRYDGRDDSREGCDVCRNKDQDYDKQQQHLAPSHTEFVLR